MATKLRKGVPQALTTGYDAAAKTWTFGFPAPFAPIVLHRAKIAPAIFEMAGIERMRDRVVDKAAKAAGTSLDVKHAAVKGMVDYLETGTTEWNMGATARVPVDDSADVREAIKRVKAYDDASVDKFIALLAAKSFAGDAKAALAHMKTSERVATEMVKMRSERLGKAALDADAELDGIKV